MQTNSFNLGKRVFVIKDSPKLSRAGGNGMLKHTSGLLFIYPIA